jgi:prophage regulatory protein
METLLRIQDVESALGMRRANIYKMIRRGDFPKQLSVGKRAVRWKASEVQAWIESRHVRE